MRRSFFGPVATLCLAVSLSVQPFPARASDFVIQISVDGLGSSYLQSLIAAGQAPNFARFQTEGAWTNNARADFDYTITLPNHTSMLTGRPVLDKSGVTGSGHFYTDNGDPGSTTLASNRGFYLSSTFDVAHDRGLSTALYATKSKFVLYDQSYNATNGGPDLIGPDNGRDKIDVYVNDPSDSAGMVSSFLTNMSAPTAYTFMHFYDPDGAGHEFGWGGTQYNNAIKSVDSQLGQIFNLANTNPQLHGRTTIILSADHGGVDMDHSTQTEPLDYTIPFYVWGAGVSAGTNLYSLNASTRLDPGPGRPDYGAGAQPIRNGDGGNLALSLLGLPAIPGSSINSTQNLAVPEASAWSLMATGGFLLLSLYRRRQK